MTTHVCPAEGCRRTIAREVFACRTHWFALSLDLRRRIASAWRRRAMKEWLEARKEAVEVLSMTSVGTAVSDALETIRSRTPRSRQEWS